MSFFSLTGVAINIKRRLAEFGYLIMRVVGNALMALGLFLIGCVGFQLTLESFLYHQGTGQKAFGLVMLMLPFAAVIIRGGHERVGEHNNEPQNPQDDLAVLPKHQWREWFTD